MTRIMPVALTLVLASLLEGCSSVNIRTNAERESSDPPTFQQTYAYWWWGLKGEYTVNVREICGANPVRQMQAVDTFSDTVLTIVTLGIYAPRTARVWCEELNS